MRAEGIIAKKRDREELSTEEIAFFIKGFLSGEVADYQMSAFLMAVRLNGMTSAETISLTKAMLNSGMTIDLNDVQGTKIDKHSTGGVGDKTSIILGPLMATMGIKVPMVSGRALGHTGGTLDKLESIPGLRTNLSASEFKENLRNIGFSVMAQSDEICPADRRMYALRDVTATVDSIPLIAASIMSKKLAEGTQGLVLDVKTGAGAFMKDSKDASRLAHTMVNIGNSMGVKTIALVTDMAQPLGRTIGNALEIKECISILRGKAQGDLFNLTLTLTAWMLNLADAVTEETPVRGMNEFVMNKYKNEALDFIEKGDAFKKFLEFVDAQGGDAESVLSPAKLPSTGKVAEIKSPDAGFITKLDARAIGEASMILGAGRKKAGDSIDHAVGFILNKKLGEEAAKGETVALVHYRDESSLKEATDAFLSGFATGPRDIARPPLVYETVLG